MSNLNKIPNNFNFCLKIPKNSKKMLAKYLIKESLKILHDKKIILMA